MKTETYKIDYKILEYEPSKVNEILNEMYSNGISLNDLSSEDYNLVNNAITLDLKANIEDDEDYSDLPDPPKFGLEYLAQRITDLLYR